jgi:hypothetical protein
MEFMKKKLKLINTKFEAIIMIFLYYKDFYYTIL